MLRHLRTFRGPFWPFLFLSLKSCHVCYSRDFSDSRYLVFLASNKNSCYFCNFATFADFSGPLLAFSLSKSFILLFLLFLLLLLYLLLVFLLLHLLFLRFLQSLSSVFLASKKNPCYFCDFSDICGLFGALLSFFSF